jgi:phospholipid/cholesterol/gamma-HCH transport system substrate-binding protein
MTAIRRRFAGASDGIIGIVAAALTVALLVAVETGAVSGLLSPPGKRTVTARFADARQLEPGDPVRITGVNVGTVQSLSLHGRAATVTMKLQSSAGPLYADAGAQIRFRTLLGGNFYVDLDRGRASSGALGVKTIPQSHTGSQVELDDITSVVQGQAKQGLQKLPGQLGIALGDPRYPARSLQTLAAQSPSLAGGLNALRGERPESDIPTLIDSANTTVQALDEPDGQLKGLVSGTASFLQATSARSADLQRTIQNAPALLDRTTATMRALSSTLHLANPLLVKLERSAPAIAPTVQSLRGTVQPANVLLNHATPLLHKLRPAVSLLASASQQALPLLDQLTPSLDELANKILPYMAKIQPDSKHSMAEMIGPGFAGLGAMGAYEDDNGHFARFPATAGSQSFYLPCQADFNPSQTQQLLACETIGQALDQLFATTPPSESRQP